MARKKSLKNRIKDLFSMNNFKKQIEKSKFLFFYAIMYGLLLNYSFWALFNFPFMWYTFPAYGLILYFIKSEVIYIFRWCFHKVPGVEG